MDQDYIQNIPEEIREEVVQKIAASKANQKDRRIKQKEKGKAASQKIKELRKFVKKHNVLFFEYYGVSNSDYTCMVGYIPPSSDDSKKPRTLETVYSVAFCSPTDNYSQQKAEDMIVERLRNGKAKMLPFRKNAIKVSEYHKIPQLIQVDLLLQLITGVSPFSIPHEIRRCI